MSEKSHRAKGRFLKACLLPLVCLLLLPACASVYHPTRAITTYTSIADTTAIADAAMEQKIKPYRERMQSEMSRIVAKLETPLLKQRPESTMGNWMADAMLERAQAECQCAVDLAISNYGGMRIPEIPAGPVPLGKFFEVMPFDNTLVILELKGSFLRQFFKKIAEEGGWPVSKGVRLEIGQGNLYQALVAGKDIEDDSTYRVVTSNYLAEGGDRCFFLINQPRRTYKVLMRDALIQQAEALEAAGKPIRAAIEGRIIQKN